MAYKVSGSLSEDARIIVIDESDWSVESNTNETAGSYSIETLDIGKKTVLARKSSGEGTMYGNVDAIKIPGYDEFEGPLDTTNTWDVFTNPIASASATGGELLCTIGPNATDHCGAWVETQETFPRSGTLTIEVEWNIRNVSVYYMDFSRVYILNESNSSRDSNYASPQANNVYYGMSYDTFRTRCNGDGFLHDYIAASYAVSRGTYHSFKWEVNLSTGAYTIDHGSAVTGYNNTIPGGALSGLGSNVKVGFGVMDYNQTGGSCKWKNLYITHEV